MFPRQINGFFRWLPPDSVEACPKQRKRVHCIPEWHTEVRKTSFLRHGTHKKLEQGTESDYSNTQWLYLMAQKNGTRSPTHHKASWKKYRRWSSPNHWCSSRSLWGMWKRKVQETSFPIFEIKGIMTLDLVHSNLDKMPVLSIGGYKYTATYLDDHSSFRVMFYLKHKNEEFTAFKTYKAWAKRQLHTKLKCKQTDRGGEFMSKEQKAYLTENRIEHQTSMPDSSQQNGDRKSVV